MSKKLFLFFLVSIIFLIGLYYLVSFTINNDRYSFIKKFVPDNLKKTVKYYIFPHKIIEKKNQELYELNLKYDRIYDFLIQSGAPYKEEIKIRRSLDDLPFNYKTSEYLNIFGEKYAIKKFQSNFQFNSGIYNVFPGSAYLDFYNDKFFIISSKGIIGFTEKINEKDIIFKQIDSNINNFINENQFKKKGYYSIKDIRVKNNKIFVSFTDEIKKDCWSTSLLVGELKFDKIDFKKIFASQGECALEFDTSHEYNGLSSGGRVEVVDKNFVLLTHGDYGQRSLVQNKNSIFGKIFKINLNNSDYSIFSMGHRNPQGLFYDEENNFFLETEHGPQGGDEINKIENFQSNLLNYGWPISSYGEHYGGPDGRNKHRYKDFPLHKSHKKYGFIEPLYSFQPSIAISQIIKVQDNKYLVSSLKYKSLYSFELDEFKTLKNLNKIFIGERIRDITYFNNQIYLFLEDSASIAILKRS